MRQLISIFGKDVVTVGPSDTIGRAAERMEEQNVGAVVVAEQGRPVGIVTDRDIAIALGAHGGTPGESVQQIMTCPVTTMHQYEGIFDATQHMMRNSVRRMPVVNDDGRLVGLVTLDDLLVLLSRELDSLSRGVQGEVATGAR
jgi:CBS domain-containing protein